MQKRTIYIVSGLVALAVLGGGVGWYVVNRTDTSRPEPRRPAPYTGPLPTQNVPATTSAQIPNFPYEEVFPNVFVFEGTTLDPAVIALKDDVRDVSLCGGTYKTKTVLIDGVDVIQRLSTLLAAATSTKDWYCEILTSRADLTGGLISQGSEIRISIEHEHEGYVVGVSLDIGMTDLRSGTPPSVLMGFGGIVDVERNRLNVGGVYLGPLK